jgi:hypothetical protein
MRLWSGNPRDRPLWYFIEGLAFGTFQHKVSYLAVEDIFDQEGLAKPTNIACRAAASHVNGTRSTSGRFAIREDGIGAVGECCYYACFDGWHGLILFLVRPATFSKDG